MYLKIDGNHLCPFTQHVIHEAIQNRIPFIYQEVDTTTEIPAEDRQYFAPDHHFTLPTIVLLKRKNKATPGEHVVPEFLTEFIHAEGGKEFPPSKAIIARIIQEADHRNLRERLHYGCRKMKRRGTHIVDQRASAQSLFLEHAKKPWGFCP